MEDGVDTKNLYQDIYTVKREAGETWTKSLFTTRFNSDQCLQLINLCAFFSVFVSFILLYEN